MRSRACARVSSQASGTQVCRKDMEAHVSAQAAGATLREKWVGLVVSTSMIQLVPSSSRDLQQNLLSVGRCTLRLFWCWVWEARPFAWGQDMGTWQIGKGELSYHSGSRLCGHALCGGLTHSVAWPGSGRLGSCMLLGARLQTQPGDSTGTPTARAWPSAALQHAVRLRGSLSCVLELMTHGGRQRALVS